jgi:hypothetical protein
MQCRILASDLIARSGVDTCGGIEEVVPRDRIEPAGAPGSTPVAALRKWCPETE